MATIELPDSITWNNGYHICNECRDHADIDLSGATADMIVFALLHSGAILRNRRINASRSSATIATDAANRTTIAASELWTERATGAVPVYAMPPNVDVSDDAAVLAWARANRNA